MNDARLLLGFIAVTACSVDHVVVAALEDSSAGSAGSAVVGSAGNAVVGSAGNAVVGSAGAAGAVANSSSGGASAGAASGGRVSTASGGSSDNGRAPNSAGAGGVTTQILCSCLQQETEVCGSDGVTYPTECSDAGPCFPPAIACWHACPCLDADLDAGAEAQSSTRWVSADCLPSIACTGNVVCMTFNNVDRDMQTLCATAN